jgi:hypothetical protein
MTWIKSSNETARNPRNPREIANNVECRKTPNKAEETGRGPCLDRGPRAARASRDLEVSNSQQVQISNLEANRIAVDSFRFGGLSL